ncbi:MAG: hypothetical protein ACI90V_010255 [Bacillariaceae sp.]|jgi:hypothetical protein
MLNEIITIRIEAVVVMLVVAVVVVVVDAAEQIFVA